LKNDVVCSRHTHIVGINIKVEAVLGSLDLIHDELHLDGLILGLAAVPNSLPGGGPLRGLEPQLPHRRLGVGDTLEAEVGHIVERQSLDTLHFSILRLGNYGLVGGLTILLDFMLDGSAIVR